MGNGHSSTPKSSLDLHPSKTFTIHLPAEVIADILAALCESADATGSGYKRDLARCALTSQSWQNALRPYLFASLTLRSPADLDYLLRFVSNNEQIRTKVARLELCEASEPWIHDALGILPSKLPAVTALRLCSDVAVDTSESCRKPDVLPTLYAQLQQIHHLELAGSHFDDFSTFFACASAFPSLTRVQSRGITWSQPPSSAPVPGHNSPVVEVYAPKGTEVPWLWTLVNPLGGNDASAAPHPVLADADAAAFKYLFKAAMYGSSTCTYSLSHVDGSDGSRWEAAVHCHKTGNSASVTIAPDTSDDAQRTGLSVIRTATLHLTPQGSTVSTDAWDFKNRLANIDHAFSKLPDTVLLNLYWDYWGTTEWYIKEDLKGPLFRNLTRAKRLVRHLAKGKGPVPVGYLPLPYRYRTS